MRNTLRVFAAATRAPISQGQTMVEFAVAGVVTVLLFFAIFEVGRAALEQTSISNAAREAARVGAIPSSTDTQVRNRAQSLSFVAGNPTVVITNYRVNSSTPITHQTPVAKPAATPRVAGDLVEVTISHRFRPVAFLQGGSTGFPISATARMVVE
jgi:Flp pilus assembly protein TadG